jgi:hypothetical protein
LLPSLGGRRGSLGGSVRGLFGLVEGFGRCGKVDMLDDRACLGRRRGSGLFGVRDGVGWS